MGQLHRPKDRAGPGGAVGRVHDLVPDPLSAARATPPRCSPAAATVEAIDPELVAKLRSELGLDRPLWEQYLRALGKALTGDFGVSTQTGRPASDLLLESLPPTLALTAFAFVLSVVFGVALALDGLARPRPVAAQHPLVAAAARRLGPRSGSGSCCCRPSRSGCGCSRRWATTASRASYCRRSRSRSPPALHRAAAVEEPAVDPRPAVRRDRARQGRQRASRAAGPRLPQRRDPRADDGRRAHRRTALRSRRHRDRVLAPRARPPRRHRRQQPRRARRADRGRLRRPRLRRRQPRRRPRLPPHRPSHHARPHGVRRGLQEQP